MRPKGGKYDLTEEEKDGLSYYVLSGCPREIAFLKFIRPDFISNKNSATVKAVTNQFFASRDAKAYIDAYRSHLEDLMSGKLAEKPKAPANASIEERKSRALSKLVDFVLSEADKIGTDDQSDPKAIMEFANRIGLFDKEVETEEQPRRYLPVTCGDCAYRKFVEENCERVDGGTDVEEEND